MNIKITPARSKAQKQAVVDMFMKLHDLHVWEMPSTYKPITSEVASDHLWFGHQGSKVAVAMWQNASQDDVVIGYVRYAVMNLPAMRLFHRTKYLYVMEIYVNGAYRHQGVASKLMAHAEEHARKHGCTHMQGMVAGFNEKSRNMFHRNGFGVEYTRMLKALV